jgi:hypothetical protein
VLNFLVPGPDFSIGAMVLGMIAGLGAVSVSALAVLGPTIGTVALLLFGLIIMLMFLIVFINLIYKIVLRYIYFIIFTMFAPLFFLVGALPGAEGVTKNWFRRMAAALIAIPATAFFVKLSFLLGFVTFFVTKEPLPTPWIVPGAVNTVIGWAVLGPAIGLGLFFFSTKVPDIVDEILGVRELGARAGIGPGIVAALPFGAAGRIGRSMGSARNMATQYAAYGSGWRQRIAQNALRLPGIGDAHSRYMAGIASPTDEAKVIETAQRTAAYKSGRVEAIKKGRPDAPATPPAPGAPVDDATLDEDDTGTQHYT